MEDGATLKSISIRLITKWQKTYYRTCRYVKIRVAITLMQDTHRYIQGSRVKSHMLSGSAFSERMGKDSTSSDRSDRKTQTQNTL